MSSQNKTNKAVQQIAEQYGLEVGKTSKGHNFVIIGTRKVFTSGSASDCRSMLNFRAKVRRMIRLEGGTIEFDPNDDQGD